VQDFGSQLQVTSDGLYWVERSNDGESTEFIVHTALDGSDKVNLVTSPGYAVQEFGTSLRVTATGIYWIEISNDGNGTQRIVRTDLDGTDPVTLFNSPSTANLFTTYDDDDNRTANLRVTGDGLFWTERANDGSGTDLIVRAGLDGTGKAPVVTSAAYAVQNFGTYLWVDE
jgi:hypothetical protein